MNIVSYGIKPLERYIMWIEHNCDQVLNYMDQAQLQSSAKLCESSAMSNQLFYLVLNFNLKPRAPRV
jgi:hypothetical protein